MNLFEKLFGGKSSTKKTTEITPTEKEIMVGVSSLTKNKLQENDVILAETQIPGYCDIGNLIYEKKFHEAIELGNKLLKKTPSSAGVHVNLMDAYFKLRDENSIFFEKSTEHARLAMLYGHNTGYVQKRLIINLEKQRKYFQALQLCEIILLDKFHFSKHGSGNKDEFEKRKAIIEKKINQATDTVADILFSENEIFDVIKQIREDEEREKKEQLEYEKRMREHEKQILRYMKK